MDQVPASSEVRWHAATKAFEEPEISEDADRIALGFEAFLAALVVVVLALTVWSMW